MVESRQIDTTSEDPAWARAQAKAADQRGLYTHLVTFVLVGGFLVVLDLAGGSSGTTFVGLDWAFWPIGGWAIGVLLHVLLVFGIGSGWERRQAERLYERERQRDR